jgi:endonuclease/exonuclease/phosphatase family metal-dependent hydrolase
MFSRLTCTCVILMLLLQTDAYSQLRIVSQNTLGKPVNTTDENLVRTIYDAIATRPASGIAKRPDLIALQEQTSGSPGTNGRFASAMNNEFATTDYQTLILSSGNFRQAYVYDSSVLTPIASSEVFLGGLRPAVFVQWQLVGYDSNSEFFTYNVHFKAGDTSSDLFSRNLEATNLRANADNLGAGAHVIYMGDFNFSGSDEQSFATMKASGDGQAFDPLNLVTWPSIGTRIHLTQSTRVNALPDGGATGGLNDRFDHQMVTGELLDGEGLSYMGFSSTGFQGLENSYIAFGNDGAIYNGAINATYQNREQPMEVLDALHDFSDHLPVVADYQLPARMSVTLDNVPSAVIAGATVNVQFVVENSAPVSASFAADELDYVFTTSGDLDGLGNNSDPATGGGITESFDLETGTVGLGRSGMLLVTASSQQAGNAISDTLVQFDVLDHSNASFSDKGNEITSTVNLGSFAIGGTKTPVLNLKIFNRASSNGNALTADLDLDSIVETDIDDLFAISGPQQFSNLQAGSFENYNVSAMANTVGNFSATYHFNVSDENIPGETAGLLTLNLTMTVAGVIGDMDGSGQLTNADIAAFVLALTNPAGFAQTYPDVDPNVIGDFNGDGAFTNSDIAGFVAALLGG